MTINWLDITTTLLGLAYILLEYKVSVWLWLVGFVMQALDIVLYYDKGLYADCGMEFYYIAMTIYGFINWKFGTKWWRITGKKRASKDDRLENETNSKTQKLKNLKTQDLTTSEPQDLKTSTTIPIAHFKRSLILPWTFATLAIWGIIYYLLVAHTNSRVPIADSFTTALSFVGIWALARKYLEQWLIWIAVDVVTSALYFYKDIPFKASLYALYVVIAILGYRKWKRLMRQQA